MHTTTLLFWFTTIAWIVFTVNAFNTADTQDTVTHLIPKVNTGGNQVEKIEQVDEDKSHQQHHSGHHVNKITLGNNNGQQPALKILRTKSDPTSGGPAVLGLRKRRFMRRAGGKKQQPPPPGSSPATDLIATKLVELDPGRKYTADPDKESGSKKSATQSSPVDKLLGSQAVKLADPNDPAALKKGTPPAAVVKTALGGDPIVTVTPPNNFPGPVKPAPAPPPEKEP
ncbi:hypothetical protein BDA99DRAFT_558449 [Phascolomyces articulosus]|uniref:Uncharacterized protein n=1 Tax=Phascolomyces articulosus TaxID=60185 RepID=A0AAD5KES4_9FUNG|nr:hypothetical protein BDA99DRAFT_558449 [Phascolomyces articulosus]